MPVKPSIDSPWHMAHTAPPPEPIRPYKPPLGSKGRQPGMPLLPGAKGRIPVTSPGAARPVGSEWHNGMWTDWRPACKCCPPGLTGRQWEYMEYLTAGYDDLTIGRVLGSKPKAAYMLRTRALEALGFDSFPTPSAAPHLVAAQRVQAANKFIALVRHELDPANHINPLFDYDELIPPPYFPAPTTIFEKLTVGQLRVVRLIAEGQSNREIEQVTGYSYWYTQKKVKAIYKKLGVAAGPNGERRVTQRARVSALYWQWIGARYPSAINGLIPRMSSGADHYAPPGDDPPSPDWHTGGRNIPCGGAPQS